jgi:hypothetical protein
VGLLALLVLAGYLAFRAVTGAVPDQCTVADGGERVELIPQQAANAATIGAVASGRDLPERALTIALATAMQESQLRDLRGGDRDSLGLFQQRPSQGWGTARQISDPVYSANQFFDELVKIPDYTRLPVTVAAQQVQHSGYPQAYARHAADASLLAAALSGRAPGLSCALSTGEAQDEGAGDPAAIRQRLAREFGPRTVGRPQTGSPAPGTGDGGTVTVPASAVAAAKNDRARHGWVLAQWAVAHALALRVAEVSYDGQVWRARQSADGWTSDPAGAAGASQGDVSITVAR